jgi:ceramide glucosyltransferase
MFVLTIFAGLLLILSCIYHLLTVYCALLWKRGSNQVGPPQDLSAITILKPLRGSDPEQYASFESFCAQDYAEYQIVFGALDPNDPGLDNARKLQAAYPSIDIEVVAGGEAFGLNRKICNLANMLPSAKHDLLVLCDSDMRVLPDYLRRIAEPFASEKVGLVTCPYRGYNAKGIASILEALGIGADFIPGVFVAYYIWGVRPAFGSTIALKKSTLTEIGGFEEIADELADDYKLAELVAGIGKDVVLSGYVVDDVLGRESMGEMWSRRLRWSKTARSMRPGPYTGAFITFTTPLAVLFAATCRLQPLCWIAPAAALTLRAATVTFIATKITRDSNLPRNLILLPLSELVSFSLWAASFFGCTILWRGERFKLARGGKLEKT